MEGRGIQSLYLKVNQAAAITCYQKKVFLKITSVFAFISREELKQDAKI
jgi:hypothetical protein